MAPCRYLRGSPVSAGAGQLGAGGPWIFMADAAVRLSIFVIVGLIAYELVVRSELTLHKFGLEFFFQVFTDPTRT